MSDSQERSPEWIVAKLPSAEWLIRRSLKQQPLFIAVLGLIAAGELLPAFFYGPRTLFGTAPSTLLIGGAAIDYWKWRYLKACGSRAESRVVDIQTWEVKSSTAASATVLFQVDGVYYVVHDPIGGYLPDYALSKGDKVTVYYDSEAPNIAGLGVPDNRGWLHAACLVVGAALYLAAWRSSRKSSG